MFIQRQEDGSVAVANIKHDETWIEVTELPGDQDTLSWAELDSLPAIDVNKVNGKLITHFTDIVSDHIQAEIDTYNAANGVVFGNVHALAIYKDDVAYPHNTFAVSMITWNSQVWESARNIQADVAASIIALPTDEEFIAMLPARV